MSISRRTASRATIQDVAEHSGVSTGTVSRVLNQRAGVSEVSRLRVLQAVEELNYQPDHAARTLSLKAVTVGLNLPQGARRLTPFFMLFLEHLIAELQPHGYRFTEVPTGANGLPAWLPEALILHGASDDDPRIAYLRARNVPFVLVGHSEDSSWVAPDDVDGGDQATSHLIRLGHTRILFLSGTPVHQSNHDRYRGYLNACARAGLEPLEPCTVRGVADSLAGYRAVRHGFGRAPGATAIVAASDELARGAVAALEDLGLRVPLDVSVVGYDDLPETGADLTTIHQDVSQLCATTVALLRERMEGLPPRGVNLPVQLKVRGTTTRRKESTGPTQ